MSVEIKGLQELKKDFRQYSVKAVSTLEKSLLRGSLIVERTAKENLTKNRNVSTARLRNSITHRLGRETPLRPFAEVGTNVEYARDVEYGTSPHYVPFRPLQLWARRKGLKAESANALAAYTQLKISMYGTKPHPYLNPALKDNINQINRDIAEAIHGIP